MAKSQQELIQDLKAIRQDAAKNNQKFKNLLRLLDQSQQVLDANKLTKTQSFKIAQEKSEKLFVTGHKVDIQNNKDIITSSTYPGEAYKIVGFGSITPIENGERYFYHGMGSRLIVDEFIIRGTFNFIQNDGHLDVTCESIDVNVCHKYGMATLTITCYN